MNDNTCISYRINSREEITFINDEWFRFAADNNALELVRDNILNCSLWDFISDEKVKHIYQEILRRVNSGHFMKFKLRCDSPEMRRIIEISITPLKDGEVQFDSKIIWTEARMNPILFKQNVPRTDNLVIICSWCNKIETRNGNWQEVEEAVETLRLFELETLPLTSHGMCGACFEKVTSELDKLKTLENHS